jgi:hypothetical protein
VEGRRLFERVTMALTERMIAEAILPSQSSACSVDGGDRRRRFETISAQAQRLDDEHVARRLPATP